MRAWPLWCAELVGTALLVGVGCSLVILDFGASSPVAAILPGAAARRALTGFLFGSVGAMIALSPVGKVSGAHINPVVTLAFWLERRMSGVVALGYVAAQLVGGVLGALPLRLWGAMGSERGLRRRPCPVPAGAWIALAGEAGATFCLVAGLLLFVGPRAPARLHARALPARSTHCWSGWRRRSPAPAPTRPERLGPGLVAGDLHGWWIYWLGPLAGTLAAVALRLGLPWTRSLEIRVAKVFHFGHDAYGIFTEKSVALPAPRLRPVEGEADLGARAERAGGQVGQVHAEPGVPGRGVVDRPPAVRAPVDRSPAPASPPGASARRAARGSCG